MGAFQFPLVDEFAVDWVLRMAQTLNQADFDGILMMIWAIGSARNLKFWVEILNLMPNIVASRAFNW